MAARWWLHGCAVLAALAMALRLSSGVAYADDSRRVESGGFAIEVDVRAQANLIYQLDCISGANRCTAAVFEDLWRNRIGLDAADLAQLEAWATLRQQVQRAGGSDEMPDIASAVPLTEGSASPWDQIRRAEYLAPSRDALEQEWRRALGEEAARKQLAVLAHFRPRFRKWWSGNERVATQLVPNLEAALQAARGPELLSAAARLYGADLGERRVFVHLIVQPNLGRQASRAEIFDGHMVIEVQAGEGATDIVPVVIHELSHHVWARVPVARKALVANQMLGAGHDGVAAWNLFDEVQATAIGNMLAGRSVVPPEQYRAMLQRPLAFYADEAIDRGARATVALFEGAMQSGRAMDAGFVRAFVEALRRELGPLFDTPMLHLRNSAINLEDGASPWIDSLAGAVQAWGVWTYHPLGAREFTETLGRFPGMSASVFVTLDQLQKLGPMNGVLGATVDELRQSLSGSRGVAFISERTPQAIVVVFLVRDAAVMGQLISAVPSCPLRPGVCARVE